MNLFNLKFFKFIFLQVFFTKKILTSSDYIQLNSFLQFLNSIEFNISLADGLSECL